MKQELNVQLTTKLKILRNPAKKSARELLKAINKEGYEVSIKNREGIIVRIDKKNVPLSLNDRKNPENLRFSAIIQSNKHPQNQLHKKP